jgi:hypothetical protein
MRGGEDDDAHLSSSRARASESRRPSSSAGESELRVSGSSSVIVAMRSETS